MSKILTDDLILEKLEENGVLPIEDLDDYSEKLTAIKDHFDFDIDDNWGNPDFMFYSETTADGYEVWIATDNDRNPSVNQDIYYYDNDWLEKMANAMYDGNSIYFQEYDEDASNYEFQDVIDEVYESYFNDKKQDIENELIEKGYEYENE